ncbi:hypothetical protein [Sphingobacterium anhuiense]|uniref:hypothetical protein n=1 Tax=Sphingobacterium anhuiense TaxID=493780 RepID=UPI003C2AD724
MEYVSLGLSVLAILGSLMGYLLHDRRLKAQELKINAYNLFKIESEQLEFKKAEVRASLIKGDRGKCTVKIYNKGKARAHQVRLIMDDQDFLISNTAFPLAFMNPQESAEFYIHLSMGSPDSMLLKIMWDDDYQKNNEHQQILTF